MDYLRIDIFSLALQLCPLTLTLKIFIDAIVAIAMNQFCQTNKKKVYVEERSRIKLLCNPYQSHGMRKLNVQWHNINGVHIVYPLGKMF